MGKIKHIHTLIGMLQLKVKIDDAEEVGELLDVYS